MYVCRLQIISYVWYDSNHGDLWTVCDLMPGFLKNIVHVTNFNYFLLFNLCFMLISYDFFI